MEQSLCNYNAKIMHIYYFHVARMLISYFFIKLPFIADAFVCLRAVPVQLSAFSTSLPVPQF